MAFLEAFDLIPREWILLYLAGFLIGLDKIGLRGAAMVILPFLAVILGGKNSAGFVLTLLIAGDIYAVIYYKRKCKWGLILKLFPWAAGGIVLALIIGNMISDQFFKRIMGFVLLFMLILMVYREWKKSADTLPKNPIIAAGTGLAGGFSTMIGNAAGPIMSMYLLSMNIPKEVFIGTGAWFFFIVNLSKFPLHYFVWKSITKESLLLSLMIIPVIYIGTFFGRKIVQRIPEKGYRFFIIAATFLGVLKLFF